jgi:hypothetical protein
MLNKLTVIKEGFDGKSCMRPAQPVRDAAARPGEYREKKIRRRHQVYKGIGHAPARAVRRQFRFRHCSDMQRHKAHGQQQEVYVQIVSLVLGVGLYVLFSLLDVDTIADKARILYVLSILFISTLFIWGT